MTRPKDPNKAPPIKSDHWINSPALTKSDLKGKVQIVFFFSVNEPGSENVYPHMRYLWSKLKKHRVMIIGVHSPCSEKEKDPERVEREVKRHGLEFPIALDNDYYTWRAYGNQFFGQRHLIDQDGFVWHTRAGEGMEEEIEAWLVRLMEEAGIEVDMEPELGGVVFEGGWCREEEFLEYDSEKEGRMSLRYLGSSLFFAMSSPSLAKLEVLLDGKSVTSKHAGKDLVFQDSKSYVVVGQEKEYEIIKQKECDMHEAVIIVRTQGLKVSGFGVC